MDEQPQQNLVWDLMRVIGPAIVFVVVFLTLALVVDMNFFAAGGIALVVAVGDFLLFAWLKKRTGS